MNILAKARRYVVKFGSVSGAAQKLQMPRSSLRRLLETPSTNSSKTAPAIEPKTGKWMQSLHHDTAHFITDGRAACEGAQNGAKIVGGSMWHPHDGCTRKCLRCLKRAENE